MALAAGTTLDHYQISSLIGEGGMGQVYEAFDVRLKRKVAIKIVSEALGNSEEALARFEREARSLAQLGHPNIVAIFDALITPARCVVMEYLEGETLREKLGKGALPWRRALDIASSVADGLAAAHAKGIIHRDIKPENIFLTKDGQVKILDFGIARLKTGGLAAQEQLSTMPMLTRTGAIIGTVAYMSPEQIRGEDLDDTTDIFSLGCVLYEMITGSAPFSRQTLSETRKAILNDEPAEISDPGVPSEVRRIISNCLGKEPGVRFQAARDLSLTLRGVLPASLLFPSRGVEKSFRHSAMVYVSAVSIALLLVVLAILILPRFRQSHARSIAVLPFENLGQQSSEYLSDGLTENIINDLSDIRLLRILPRSSVFRFKRAKDDLHTIAQKLSADVLVTGRLVETDGRIQVQAELIDASSDAQIWGHRYDVAAADLMKVETDIASAIALKVGVGDTAPIARQETTDAEAYRLYMKGRYYWEQRTSEGLQKAIESFEAAVRLDVRYALAYAGLADAYILETSYAGKRPEDTYPKALRAAQKALEIDPSLAEAHTSLAAVKEGYDFDWAGAEKEYQQAIHLKPAYVTAHQWYGQHLLARARFDEAETQFSKAQSLDPASLKAQVDTAWLAAYRGKYDLAAAKANRILAESPTYSSALELSGWIYSAKGEHDRAIAAFEKIKELDGDVSGLPLIAHEFALTGRAREAHAILRDLISARSSAYVPPYQLASIYAALAEKALAFQYLNEAVDQRDENIALLRIDPDMAVLRSDPKFGQLLKRVGL
jgi:serine/threonine protein kinase/Tfp pilus assembly protein PilF